MDFTSNDSLGLARHPDVVAAAEAALRAQAVACRSYVLYQMEEMEDQPYDVTGDVLSQRYLGVRGESDAAWAALRATNGAVSYTHLTLPTNREV